MSTEPSLQALPKSSSRDRILNAAKVLFATQGYENTSTVAIARMAGTSESQLVKHFSNKEGLLEAIFDHAWYQMNRAIRSLMAGYPSPDLRLRALVEGILAALERDPEVKFLMLFEGRRLRRAGQQVVLDHGFLEFVKIIDEILAQMSDQGRLQKGLSIEVVRSSLMGCVEGLLRDQLLAKRMDYPAKYNLKEIRAAFELILSAFMNPPPAASRKARPKSKGTSPRKRA